jgi:hypothetical protein
MNQSEALSMVVALGVIPATGTGRSYPQDDAMEEISSSTPQYCRRISLPRGTMSRVDKGGGGGRGGRSGSLYRELAKGPPQEPVGSTEHSKVQALLFPRLVARASSEPARQPANGWLKQVNLCK